MAPIARRLGRPAKYDSRNPSDYGAQSHLRATLRALAQPTNANRHIISAMVRPDFPAALLAAQQELHETTPARSTLYDRLPRPVEAHGGFKDPDIWRSREPPASEGWPQEDQA